MEAHDVRSLFEEYLLHLAIDSEARIDLRQRLRRHGAELLELRCEPVQPCALDGQVRLRWGMAEDVDVERIARERTRLANRAPRGLSVHRADAERAESAASAGVLTPAIGA